MSSRNALLLLDLTPGVGNLVEAFVIVSFKEGCGDVSWLAMGCNNSGCSLLLCCLLQPLVKPYLWFGA